MCFFLLLICVSDVLDNQTCAYDGAKYTLRVIPVKRI